MSAQELRGMDLNALKAFAQKLGINLTGLEDRESAVRTRLIQNAVEIEPDATAEVE